jgi:rhodanese-related sulfurtransferase
MPKIISSIVILLAVLISSNVFARCEKDMDLPLRDVYLTVDCINASELALRIEQNNAIIVDARTNAEFEILKIKGAVNIDIDKRQDFIVKLKNLAEADNRDIIFYCNGQLCNLSYRAGTLAKEVGVSNSYVYDGGIFKFSKVQPNKTLLFDKKISDSNKPLTNEQLKAHMIPLTEFEERISNNVENGEDFRILDIRDKSSHHGTSAFVGVRNEKYIPLERTKKLRKFLNKVADKNIPLYVYDWGGTKLKWVQYFIEQQGIEEYYFLDKGAFNKYNQELKKEGLPPLIM